MATTAGFRSRVVRLALASGAASIGAVGIGLLLGGSAASAAEDEPRGLLSGIVHDVAHTTGSGVEAVLDPVDQVLHEVDRGLRPVEAAVRPVTEPVVRPVAPVVERVLDVPAQVTAPVATAVEPVVDVVRPVVAPVVAPLEPVTTPVRELVGDVVDPVVGTVDRAVGALPVVDDLLGDEPVRGVVEPVVDAVAPVVDGVVPAPGASEPGAEQPGAGAPSPSGPDTTDPEEVAPADPAQDAGDPAAEMLPEPAPAETEGDAQRAASTVPFALRAVGPTEAPSASEEAIEADASQERALSDGDGHGGRHGMLPAPSGAPAGSSGAGGGAAASAAAAADHLELAIAGGEACAIEHDRAPGSLAEEPGSSPD